MKIKRFIIANIIGVIIAAAIITILALTGAGIFHIFIR
jgi:membrane protein DedA with SNARE-associated domain